ncbi:hypothetical protein R5R35_010783 [Gryllus longicercus]|uniref:Transportin-3 n=1 Tax=Gryllus longicercus TaxID=2509291 RepID=A0AAN9VBC1_9ORTH
MDAPPTLTAVHEAVYTLYHDPDTSKKEMASQWLHNFQKSVYAWKIANEVLYEKRSVESCYFASQTIRSKIQYSFCELPVDTHISLRDSLLEHLRQASDDTSAVIVMQLCLAIADLALQMSSWQSPVKDLINLLGENHTGLLLQILGVLPEEVNSSSLRLGANRRNEILMSLRSVSQTVAEYLQYCISRSEDKKIQMKVFNCFASWISIQAVAPNDIIANIVSRALGILKNPSVESDIHDAASDCLCALFPFLEENNQQTLEMQVLAGVTELEECFLFAVAHEDKEKSINYCCIFTEIAEAFLEKILNVSTVEKPHFAINVFDLVLKCIGHYDYEVVEITFGLWHRLSDALYQRDSDTLNAVFKPYVQRLLVYLRRHCEMEADQTGILEDGDDFADFRVKVSELVKDLAFIPGATNCFHLMFLSLQQPNVTWRFTEAALFVMKAIAKQIFPEENDVVPKVVEMILNLPETTHLAVRYTSVLLLGELCEWLEKHPQSIEMALNFLLHSLQQPHLSTAAAIALQNICCASRDYMTVHFSGLMQIIQFMDNFGISNEAAIGLLKGVSVTLSRLPPDHIQEAMEQICRIQIMHLNQLVENDVAFEKDTHSDPVRCFDRLATVFKFVNPPADNDSAHPCLRILLEMWPYLSKACNKYQGDVRVMERCCRCLRFAIRCVGKQSTQILEPLVQQIVVLHQVHFHSCFLYLGSILVDEYGSEPSCTTCLLNMLQAFVGSTLRIFKDASSLKNYPDTVDDFFRLCTRVLQKMPSNFLQCSSFPCIWDSAITACSLDHRDANSSVMKFINNLILAGRFQREDADYKQCQSLVKSVLHEKGQLLVTTLIHTSVFYLHSYMMYNVAELIVELKHSDRVLTCQWLLVALQSLPTQNSSGCVTATPEQLNEFYQCLTTSTNPKEIAHALRDFVRLYR